MTTEATFPATAASPTARQVWTRARGIALALVLLLVGAVAIAVVRSDTRHGELDPRSADPYGSRAVAELLADRGVATRVVGTLDEAKAAAGPDTTVLVAAPDLLTERQQTELHATTYGSGGRTVLVAPGGPAVERLAPGVTADPAISFDSTLAPACDLPAARRAGDADTGGLRYSTHLEADACYPSRRLATLLRVPDPSAKASPGAPGATPSSSAPPTFSSTNASTSTATRRSPSNSSVPATIWSGTSPPSPTSRNRTTNEASSTCSPPAGSGAPCNSSSPPPSPPCGGHADSAPWCPRNSPSRSAPPRPSKAAPASTARRTPATARPPLFAPPPAPASPLS